jgi:rhomboid protease GluP
MRGWLWICGPLLVLTLTGFFAGWRGLMVGGEIAWAALVLAPSMLSLAFTRCQSRQRFGAARRVAMVIRLLHPGDGWKELPELMRALDLAQHGQEAEALAILRRHENVQTANGLVAASQLYRITNRWEDLMEWRKEHLSDAWLTRHPGFLLVVLRAFGETGDLNAMLAWFERFERQIEHLPIPSRSHCRLSIYAFCGRSSRVEQVFRGPLSAVPADVQEFWMATALAAEGNQEARSRFETLSSSRDHLLRSAARRRLSHALANPRETLSDSSLALLSRVEQNHDQEERFGSQPGLWTRRAVATQLLLGANLILFALELTQGGSTNIHALFKLGALHYGAVREGQWWRLGSSLFLHYGAVHLSMNLFALGWLGPFVESALGSRRFLVVYLLAGIGSSGAALLKMAILSPDQFLVGASGAIMGLIGATAAIAFRGWRRERARPASRRLVFLLVILATQTVFDLLTPVVSMTAHLAGAACGFIVTSLLKHPGSERRAPETTRGAAR